MTNAESPKQPVTYWFEIQDIVNYFFHHPHPTGIQRLTLEIYAALQRDAAIAPHIRFCRFNPGNKQFETVDLEEAQQHHPERITQAVAIKKWRDILWDWWLKLCVALPVRYERILRGLGKKIYSLLRSLYHGSLRPQNGAGVEARRIEIVCFNKGDVLVTLGAFWVAEGYGVAIKRFKQSVAFKYLLLIYDLVPVRCQEWMLPITTENFQAELLPNLRAADRILTISEFTRQDLLNYGKENGLDLAQTATLKLGGSAPGGHLREQESLNKEDQALMPRGPFVLFVSTIEIRKNHIVLLRVWKKLLTKYGSEKVPPLVFVGRVGWMVEDLMAQLRHSENLKGKIILLNKVSDTLLNALYAKCLFTLYPSLYEGWGLPVAESLHHGAFCIASSATSIPEVGGDLVDYFDPENVSDAYAKIEHAILNPDYVQARKARIAAEYRPPSWDASARDLWQHLLALGGCAAAMQDGSPAIQAAPLPADQLSTQPSGQPSGQPSDHAAAE